MYNVVVDKITLERTFMTLVSALSTVLPFIWALKPPLSVDGQNLSTCELTPQEANVIRGMLTQDSSNITCWYNIHQCQRSTPSSSSPLTLRPLSLELAGGERSRL